MKLGIYRELLLGGYCQKDIADVCGCSCQYVSRIFNELLNMSLLRKRGKHFELVDWKKLLFLFATQWHMKPAFKIFIPANTRENIADWFEGNNINYAFTLTLGEDFNVYTEDAGLLNDLADVKGNVNIFINSQALRKTTIREGVRMVNFVQLFADYMSQNAADKTDLILRKAIENDYGYEHGKLYYLLAMYKPDDITEIIESVKQEINQLFKK